MIHADFARKFVERIAHYTDYNINIMNEQGIIIASRNPERIGTFHETAYRMIRSNLEISSVSKGDALLGVQNGVNLLVHYGKKPIAVVGVTGEPDKVREIALIIKMSLETMVRYESQQELEISRITAHHRFYSQLFLEEAPAPRQLEQLAETLDFSPRHIRIPIVLRFAPDSQPEPKLTAVQGCVTGQDMAWTVDNRHILVYLDLEQGPAPALASWHNQTAEWLQRIERPVGYDRAYVGTMQYQLADYHRGLDACRWLERNLEAGDRVLYFSDHLSEYLLSLLPAEELRGLFSVYDHALEPQSKNSILRMVGALQKNDFNLVRSSEALFLHKNALVFRPNKLRAALGITRQTAVLAFQYGDGISNTFWFTNGTLLIYLGLAKVPLKKWYKFILPLHGLYFIVEFVFLFIAVQTGYGPF